MPPRFLIIDDGWQLTAVDEAFSKAPTAELAERMQIDRLGAQGARVELLLESTEEDFFNATEEILAETGRRFTLPGTPSGIILEPLANMGPAAAGAHHHSHHPSHGGGSSSSSAAAASAGAAAPPSAANSSGSKLEGSALASAGELRQARGAAAPGAADGSGGKPGGARRRAAAPSAAAGATATVATTAAAPPSSSSALAKPEATAAAAAQPTVTGSLSSADAVADQKEKDKEEEAVWVVRLAQKAAGAVVGLASSAFVILYQWVVEPAPPDSLPVRAFAALARGVLRPGLLSFYATCGDFTKRLVSIKANGKFSSPDAGALWAGGLGAGRGAGRGFGDRRTTGGRWA